jgi:ATP-binding cassette subfamily C protein
VIEYIVIHFTKSEKVKLILLIILLIFVAGLEFLGIGAFSEILQSDSKSGMMIDSLGLVPEGHSSKVVLGIVMAVALLFKSVLSIISSRYQAFMVYDHMKILTLKLFKKYSIDALFNKANLDRNDATRTIIREPRFMAGGLLSPFMNILSESIVLFAIILLLGTTSFLGSLYGLIIGFVIVITGLYFRNSLRIIGRNIQVAEGERLRDVKYAISGSQDVYVSSMLPHLLGVYAGNVSILAKGLALQTYYRAIPRLILESSGFIVIGSGSAYLYLTGVPAEQVISETVLLVVIFLRILPSFNRILINYQSLSANKAILDLINREMSEIKGNPALYGSAIFDDSGSNLAGSSMNIEIEGLTFGYGKPLIENLSCSFPSNTLTVISGESGVGKSSLIDVILGLKIPESGKILLNSVVVEKIDPLLHQIAYVPQRPLIFADSPYRNITLLDDVNAEVCETRLKMAIKFACLEDVITPLNWHLSLGESGELISGGQAQRVALARAIYSKCSLIILDEITSALDERTETELVKNLLLISKEATVICISHSKVLIESADNVVHL